MVCGWPQKGRDPISRPVSFCLLTIEDLDRELELFRDINDNQMGMNTSHLQNITARLLGDKLLKVQNPALYIVQRLMKDKKSPLYKMVHEGGKVEEGRHVGGADGCEPDECGARHALPLRKAGTIPGR